MSTAEIDRKVEGYMEEHIPWTGEPQYQLSGAKICNIAVMLFHCNLQEEHSLLTCQIGNSEFLFLYGTEMYKFYE